MAKAGRQSLRFRMVFPGELIGEPLIHTLSHEYKVVPNIMRGRIAESSAWMEVELVGSARALKRAIDYLKGRGVDLKPLK